MGLTQAKGGLVAWGNVDYGQLGLTISLADDKPQPPRIVEALRGVTIKQIACGGNHSAAVTEGGELWLWGAGRNGELGTGDNKDVYLPRVVRSLMGKIVKQVSCSDCHCGVIIDTGATYTWGKGQNGRLGHGTEKDQKIPLLVEALSSRQVVQISCGDFHSAALTAEDEIYTWGLGVNGRLGHGDERTHLLPVRVEMLQGLQIQHIACGGHHTAAIAADGFYTWGGGAFGKLGHGETTGELTPRRVGALDNVQVRQAACGAHHTAVVTEAGHIYTWGQGGRLGHVYSGAEPDELFPRRVQALEGYMVLQISCGTSHTACVTAAGDVWAWGTSRLFSHTEQDCPANMPFQVPTLQGKAIVEVACGVTHTLALSDPRRAPMSQGVDRAANSPQVNSPLDSKSLLNTLHCVGPRNKASRFSPSPTNRPSDSSRIQPDLLAMTPPSKKEDTNTPRIRWSDSGLRNNSGLSEPPHVSPVLIPPLRDLDTAGWKLRQLSPSEQYVAFMSAALKKQEDECKEWQQKYAHVNQLLLVEQEENNTLRQKVIQYQTQLAAELNPAASSNQELQELKDELERLRALVKELQTKSADDMQLSTTIGLEQAVEPVPDSLLNHINHEPDLLLHIPEEFKLRLSVPDDRLLIDPSSVNDGQAQNLMHDSVQPQNNKETTQRAEIEDEEEEEEEEPQQQQQQQQQPFSDQIGSEGADS